MFMRYQPAHIRMIIVAATSSIDFTVALNRERERRPAKEEQNSNHEQR